jgi:pilus assembly protein CpaB
VLRWSASARTRYLVLALAAALLSGVFAYLYLGGLSERVPVVVAATDIPAFARLDGDMIRTVLLPPVAVHPAAVVRADDARGRVSLVSRMAGEQILAPSLVSGDNPGEYRASLGPEERALFLTADAALGGWRGVQVGDFIDLTVVCEGTSVCLEQGLEVLEVVAGEAGALLANRDAPAAGVFLRVTPGTAERIALAVEYGKVFVSVSGYGGVPVPTVGAWLQQLLQGGEGGEPSWP